MKLGYTLLYVDDVAGTMDFYSNTFGIEKGFLHESKTYGEMNTGETKLGFVAHEVASSHGFNYRKQSPSEALPPFEVGFTTTDVEGAFNRAIENGAKAIKQPEVKPWGQTVSYVKDLNGFLVEICSPIGGA